MNTLTSNPAAALEMAHQTIADRVHDAESRTRREPLAGSVVALAPRGLPTVPAGRDRRRGGPRGSPTLPIDHHDAVTGGPRLPAR
jgi:hypothetical protein